MGHSLCALHNLCHVAFSSEGHASASELQSPALGNHGRLVIIKLTCPDCILRSTCKIHVILQNTLDGGKDQRQE